MSSKKSPAPLRRTLQVGAICASLLLLLASCGAADDGALQEVESTEQGELEGVQVSSQEVADMAVSADGQKIAVLDGAEGEGDRRSPVVYIGDQDGRVEIFRSDGVPPLVFPLLWWDGDDILVAGLECPSVQFDLLSDLGPVPLGEVCDEAATNSIYRLTPADATWTAVISDLPADDDGLVSFLAASGDNALLATAQGGQASLSLFHVDTGELVRLGPDPFIGRGASLLCVTSDSSFLLVSTPGASEDGVLTLSSELSAQIVSGERIVDVPVVATSEGAEAPAAPAGCTSSGDVFLLGAESSSLPLLKLQGSTVQRSQVVLPREPQYGEITSVKESVVWIGGPKHNFTASILSTDGSSWVTTVTTVLGFDPPQTAVPFAGGIVALTGSYGVLDVEVYK